MLDYRHSTIRSLIFPRSISLASLSRIFRFCSIPILASQNFNPFFFIRSVGNPMIELPYWRDPVLQHIYSSYKRNSNSQSSTDLVHSPSAFNIINIMNTSFMNLYNISKRCSSLGAVRPPPNSKATGLHPVGRPWMLIQ
jgi:hypothetical protein